MPQSKLRTESDFDSPSEEMSLANMRLPNTHPQELVKLSDEELCRYARQGCAASRDLLWKRYIDFMRIVVYKENKHQYLPSDEISDALQELYFAFHVTVQRYDPEHHGPGKPASFKTFLKIVVTHAFSNYCTLWRIYHKHIALEFGDEALHCSTEETGCFSFSRKKRDGHSALGWQETLLGELSSDSLDGALKRLKPKEKHLLETWLKYGRIRRWRKPWGFLLPRPNCAGNVYFAGSNKAWPKSDTFFRFHWYIIEDADFASTILAKSQYKSCQLFRRTANAKEFLCISRFCRAFLTTNSSQAQWSENVKVMARCATCWRKFAAILP